MDSREEITPSIEKQFIFMIYVQFYEANQPANCIGTVDVKCLKTDIESWPGLVNRK